MAGALETLISFDGTNGELPFGRVTQDRDGSFYGTAAYRKLDSTLTNGTIFKVTTNGALTTLVYLDGTNGLNPTSDLLLASDGNLFGAMTDVAKHTTLDGAAGSIFRLVSP